jgi:thiosulfate/3-mercaptopyruvate sulfurtransferase
MLVAIEEMERLRQDPAFRVVDVRTAERYRGEVEPIDPVAGHIPGAISAPYLENTTAEGTFRTEAQLRQAYQALLGDVAPQNVVFYCGSGVTSIQSLLAMQYAGLGEGRVYIGSWSEWIADRRRPVALGDQP